MLKVAQLPEASSSAEFRDVEVCPPPMETAPKAHLRRQSRPCTCRCPFPEPLQRCCARHRLLPWRARGPPTEPKAAWNPCFAKPLLSRELQTLENSRTFQCCCFLSFDFFPICSQLGTHNTYFQTGVSNRIIKEYLLGTVACHKNNTALLCLALSFFKGL